MKTRCLLILFGLGLWPAATAQHISSRILPRIIEAPPALPSEKSGGAIVINYHSSDGVLYGPGNYKTALWPLNMHYADLSADSLLAYGIVAFDTVVSTDNVYAFPYSAIGQPTLDSIWMTIGHENQSGQTDTLVVDVVLLDTVQFPTLISLWADTLYFSSGQSAGNQWTNTLIISLAPQLLLPADTAIGMRFRYYGALADTFGLAAGFGTDNQVCGSFPESRAGYSHFYPNSYAYWNTYNLLLPSQSGGDLYYDCNGNLEFDTLTDGANYLQNWDVAIQLSSPDIGYPAYADQLPVYVFPNPVTDWLTLTAEDALLQDSRISLRSLDGRLLAEAEGSEGSTRLNLANFANGIYLVDIKKDNWHAVRKIIVQH